MMNYLLKVLVLVGGLNWGLVGIFNFDLVGYIFGPGSTLSRIIYVLVGLAAAGLIITMITKKEERI